MVRIAINGFGRIGRLAFRQVYDDSDIEVVAINDLTDTKTLAHLLKYDTAQGRFLDDRITYTEDDIVVDGKNIRVYKESDPEKLPWEELDVDVVLECTGFFTSKDKAMKHIIAGAKKDGIELIAVMLGAEATENGQSGRYVDAKNLFNFGFENYEIKKFLNEGTKVAEIKVKK